MRDAGVGADEEQHVRLLEVGVGVGWGVETEALLVGDVRSGHALARVRVPVEPAHAEFEERSEECHFLGADLAGAEKSDALRPVLIHDRLELDGKDLQRVIPVGGPERSRDRIA